MIAAQLSQKARLGKKMPGRVLGWKKAAANDGTHWGKSGSSLFHVGRSNFNFAPMR